MSVRQWISTLSLAAVILLVFFARGDIMHAWELLEEVNPWVLLLVIPAQILSYYASGEIIASFLRSKGDLKNVSGAEITRFSLEFNFVNHILPTAGISGASYATWRLNRLGVSPARATLANVLRFVIVFVAYLVFLLIAVFALALDGQVNRLMLLFAGSLSTLIVVGTFLSVYVVSSSARSKAFGRQLARIANTVIKRATGRGNAVKEQRLEDFLSEMHHDYVLIRQSPRQLRLPLAWGFLFITLEVLLFVIVFASFSVFVNPAALLLAFGFAGFAGAFVATPGGAGAYEAVMISFLASAGVAQSVAIAGVVLARVILIILTIVTGYLFYELTLRRHGGKAAVHATDKS